MPNSFWRHLYGEPVIGVGLICSIADDPVHKGDFIGYREKTLSRAVQRALSGCPGRVVVLGAGGRDTDVVYHLRELDELEEIATRDHVKEFPQLFVDDTVILVGGGPSTPWREIKEGLFEHTPKTIVGVNRAVLLGPRATDIHFFGDARHYWGLPGRHRCKDHVDNFEGPIWTTNQKWPCDRSMVGVKGINLVKCIKKKGLCKEPDRICFNSSSGGAAIDLVAHMGAKRILLVGYDMQATGGRRSWYEEAFEGTDLGWQKNKPQMYRHFLRAMECIAKDAAAMDVEILDTAKGGAMKLFPKVKLEDEL
jgi:hypothetical protein